MFVCKHLLITSRATEQLEKVWQNWKWKRFVFTIKVLLQLCSQKNSEKVFGDRSLTSVQTVTAVATKATTRRVLPTGEYTFPSDRWLPRGHRLAFLFSQQLPSTSWNHLKLLVAKWSLGLSDCGCIRLTSMGKWTSALTTLLVNLLIQSVAQFGFLLNKTLTLFCKFWLF